MEFQGKVIQVCEPEGGTSKRNGNAWKKVVFVVEENKEQYPKKAAFTIFGAENIDKFNVTVNTNVVVQFDIDAHEYNGRWFNEVRAWSVKTEPSNGQQPQPVQSSQPANPTPVQDSLPF